jgi:hypothetical protein
MRDGHGVCTSSVFLPFLRKSLSNSNKSPATRCHTETYHRLDIEMIVRVVQSASLRAFSIALLAGLLFGDFNPPPASAGDPNWVFRRSYFSHVLPPEVQANYPVPVSRSAYRRPYLYPGFAVKSTYRYNPIEIFDGRTTDLTIYRDFSIQFEP